MFQLGISEMTFRGLLCHLAHGRSGKMYSRDIQAWPHREEEKEVGFAGFDRSAEASCRFLCMVVVLCLQVKMGAVNTVVATGPLRGKNGFLFKALGATGWQSDSWGLGPFWTWT